MDGVVKERWDVDWNSNQWDGKVAVSITFPREVQQGESFSITIVTTNISDADFEFESCSCCINRGVKISKIVLQSDIEFELQYSPAEHNEDVVTAIIPKGQSVEFTWTVDAKHSQFSNGSYSMENAIKGTYDIYLFNGEVYKNAISII